MDMLKEASKEGEFESPSSKQIDALDSEVWMVVLKACELTRHLQHNFLALATKVAIGAANTPTHESQLRFVKSATSTIALFNRDMHRVLGYNLKEGEENIEGSIKVEPMDTKTLGMSDLRPPPSLSLQLETKSNDMLVEPHCNADQNFKKRPLMSTTCSKEGSSSTVTNGNGASNGSNNDIEKDRNPKKKKVLTKNFVRVKINNLDQVNEPPVDDGYVWRKYGQKKIQNAMYPRSYYRCSHKHDMGCDAMKQVQRSDEDPTYFVVAYKGEHSCYGESAWPSSLYPYLMALKYYLPTIPSLPIFHGNNSTDKRDASSSSTTTTTTTSLNVKVEPLLPPSKTDDARVESKVGSSSRGLDPVIQDPHPDHHQKILSLNRDPLISTPNMSKDQLAERKDDDGEMDKKSPAKEMPLLPSNVVDQDWIISTTVSSEGGGILMDGIGDFFSPASSEAASGYSYTTVGNLLRLDEAAKNNTKHHHGCGIELQEKYEEVMSQYMAPYSAYEFKDLINGFSDNVEDFFPNSYFN